MIVDKIAAYLAGLLVAVLAVGLAVETARLHRAQLQLAELQATVAQEHEAAERAKAQAIEGWRADERRHGEVVLKEVRDARDSTVRADDAGRRAAAAGDSLRLRTEALAARCGGAAEAGATAAGGPTAAEAGHLLADVSGRLDQAGRELADIAERSLIAGQVCERISDSMTQ